MAVWDEDNNGAVRAYERGAGVAGTWAFVGNLDAAQFGNGFPVVAFGASDVARAAWNTGGELRDSTRPPGGVFSTPPEPLTPTNEQPGDLAIGAGGAGTYALTWSGGGPSPSARAATWVGTDTPRIAYVSVGGRSGTSPDVAVDSHGNAAAVWIDTFPAGQNPQLATAEFDIVPPFIEPPRVQPAVPTAGEPATYSAVVNDDWTQPSINWVFGFGTSPSGAKVSHTFDTPGTRNVSVVSQDEAGNLAQRSFDVKVAPAPTRGVDFNASQVSGTVFVSVPRNGHVSGAFARRAVVRGAAAITPPKGYRGFRRLGPNDNIPIGSIIDATHGVSELNMATNRSASKRQRSRFSQGVFKTLQSKNSALTTAVLLGGGNFRKQCKPLGFLAKKKKRPRRRLFGNGHGRFRTRGRHSTATVSGTKWLTQDTCSGTLTVVSRGSVKVFDFGTRRTKTVRAGHRYLARSPRR
jgi:hypothetical protein